MLNQTQMLAQDWPDAVEQSRAIIREAILQYRPLATVALFSGGNDSMTMLSIAAEYADFAFHIRTGIGIPDTYEWAYNQAVKFGVEWEEAQTPPDVYRDQVIRYGFPGPQQHGRMYSQLKERRLRELRRQIQGMTLGGRKKHVLFLTGLRAFESKRRAKYIGTPVRREGTTVWCDPILHFDSHLMDEHRTIYSLPRNPVSDLIHKSGECLCGAFARKGEMKELECWFPKVAAEIHALETEVKDAGRKRCVWGQGDIKRLDPNGRRILCSGCMGLFDDDAIDAAK